MAHFVKLGTGNVVIDAVVVHNNVLLDNNEIESEQKGIDFLRTIFNEPYSIWKQTSYNTKGGKYYNPDMTLSSDQSKAFRKNYASIGYSYDEIRDAFIPPKPFQSWLLNEDTCVWQAPVSYPSDGYRYKWNETNLNWVKVDI